MMSVDHIELHKPIDTFIFYFILITMFKKWDKVKVMSWLDLNTTYWLIDCSKEHKNAEWMEWTVEVALDDWVAGYILSFDPSLIFSWWMLELVSKARVEPAVMNPESTQVPVAMKRQIVSNRLRSYVQMISKLEEVDKTMFFEMIYDKLESILFETYWE